VSSFRTLGPGDAFAGDFRIERTLGEGGMGAVYVAEQLSTGKKRALKVMHPQLAPDEKSRRRFTEEARIGSRIDSEHVVEVVAAGVDAPTGMPWLAMELLDGNDLSVIVQNRGALPPRAVAELFLQIGHALGNAHARGIVHRDLKPENLFLATSKRRGQSALVKILDFGIAQTIAESRTAAIVTTAIGSPTWMAPEQATPGAAIRASTDVYALGLIAFFLLTGRAFWMAANSEPFNVSALLVEIMIQPPPPASVRLRELGLSIVLPLGFDAWFARATARDAAQRYPDATAAIAPLTALLAGEARPSAPPPPPPERRVAPTLVLGGSRHVTIDVRGCSNCPFGRQTSSGPFECRGTIPPRTTDGTPPDWCPLRITDVLVKLAI
jgi:serine/threonine protein kinase